MGYRIDPLTTDCYEGAMLDINQTAQFRKELSTTLKSRADKAFTVLHEAVIIKLTKEAAE